MSRRLRSRLSGAAEHDAGTSATNKPSAATAAVAGVAGNASNASDAAPVLLTNLAKRCCSNSKRGAAEHHAERVHSEMCGGRGYV